MQRFHRYPVSASTQDPNSVGIEGHPTAKNSHKRLIELNRFVLNWSLYTTLPQHAFVPSSSLPSPDLARFLTVNQCEPTELTGFYNESTLIRDYTNISFFPSKVWNQRNTHNKFVNLLVPLAHLTPGPIRWAVLWASLRSVTLRRALLHITYHPR